MDFKRNDMKFKTIYNILLGVVSALAVLMMLIIFVKIINKEKIFAIGDNRFFAVQTNSMSGVDGFNKGDIVIDQTITDKEKNELNKGDIVTYHDKQKNESSLLKNFSTKRIFDVIKDEDDKLIYIAKGDNEQISDVDYIRVDDIVGRWTGKTIPVIGGAILFMESTFGFFLCILLPLCLAFIYETYYQKTDSSIKNSKLSLSSSENDIHQTLKKDLSIEVPNDNTIDREIHSYLDEVEPTLKPTVIKKRKTSTISKTDTKKKTTTKKKTVVRKKTSVKNDAGVKKEVKAKKTIEPKKIPTAKRKTTSTSKTKTAVKTVKDTTKPKKTSTSKKTSKKTIE